MAEQIQHLHVTYNDIHNLIRQNTPKIAREFNPDLLIAIGLFGFWPLSASANHLFRWGVSNYRVFAHSFILTVCSLTQRILSCPCYGKLILLVTAYHQPELHNYIANIPSSRDWAQNFANSSNRPIPIRTNGRNDSRTNWE